MPPAALPSFFPSLEKDYLPESSSPIGYSPSQTLYTPSPNVTRPSSPSKLLPYTRPNSPSSKPPVQVVERHPQPWSKVHWTRDWSWVMYTVNLGTGAVSLCVSSIPYPFRGQHAIGAFVRRSFRSSVVRSNRSSPHHLFSFFP